MPIFSSELILCLSAKEWRAALAYLGHPKDAEPFISGPAMTSTYTTESGALRFVVSFNTAWMANWSLPELIGAIAHEVLHVWQGIKEQISEPNPSHEFEACTVQWLTGWIAAEVHKIGQLGDPE